MINIRKQQLNSLLRVISFCVILFHDSNALLAEERLPPQGVSYDRKDPPHGAFVDDWMEIYVSGHKAGYQNIYFIRKGDEVHTRSKTYYKIGRDSVAVEIKAEQKTIETLDGRPLEIDSKIFMGKQPIAVKGAVEGDSIRIKMTQGEQIVEEVYPLGKDTLMAWGMARQSWLYGYEPGTEYSLSMYSPDLSANTLVESHMKVLNKEQVDYFGTPLELVKVEMAMKIQAHEIKTYIWVNNIGQAVKMKMDAAGIPMEFYLTDMETALADFETAEIFNKTLVPIHREISPDAIAVKYKVQLKDGALFNFPLPETDMQTVEKLADGTAIVTVKRSDHDEIKDVISLENLPNSEIFTRSNIMINKDDPALIALLEQALDGEDYPLVKKAHKLQVFVSRFIKKKNLGVGFAGASEVCRNREGDCTEHAVLLAALARVSGIPSRVVAGLVYIKEFAGQSNVMGYHMWTQFYLDGRWVDFDSMFKESECSVGRIALGTSSLDDISLSEIGFALWDVIGNLNIEVVDVDVPSLF